MSPTKRRFSHRTAALLFGGVLAAAAIVVTPAPGVAARHLRLVRAQPAVDTTLTAAPTELKLYYSEAVKPAVTAVRLMTSDSAIVALGALATGDKGTETHPPVVAPITGDVKPGAYRVMWRVTGADGHTITGNFTFTVKNAAAGKAR
jgi:methionine-rich copper-binding protein CopC